MKYWYLIPIIPLYIFLNAALFSFATGLISKPSDVAVIVGVLLLCVMLAGNILLIKTIKNKLK